ncbi:MAG: FAD-binding oxidoreductase [Desulfuromonadales bacterium]|nr:FAD-binding oxidoreductase [Desulfuromonadales bacterium]
MNSSAGYDVIIIGGGIQGCATAYHLARRGIDVLLLEAESCGRHASGANAGGVRCLNRLVEEIPLSLAAQRIWLELEDELGSDCGFRATGQVRIAENQADMSKLEERATLVRSFGFHHEEMIDRAELRKLVPAVAEYCIGALVCRNDGYAKPFLTTRAYLARAGQEGATVLERHPVSRIERERDSWRVTASGRHFHAKTLVNCAGAWGDRIAEMVGDKAPLEVEALALMVTARVAHFIDPVIGMASRKLSFKQMQNGTVVIGGALRAKVIGDRQHAQLDFAPLKESADTVRTVFPQLANLPVVRAWAGLEGVMPDKLPVIGASPTAPDVFHAFGFSAHGFQLAPAVGLAMADLVTSGQSDFDLSAFRIDRFQGGRPQTGEINGH